MKYPASLDRYGRRWARLRAWRAWAPIIIVAPTKKRGSTGACDLCTGDIRIEAGKDAGDGYATLLHEMAHRMAGDYHGARWRAAYLAAAAEVAGCTVASLVERITPPLSKTKIDRVVAALMRGLIAKGRLPDGS